VFLTSITSIPSARKEGKKGDESYVGKIIERKGNKERGTA
jgi:hypothetical protein